MTTAYTSLLGLALPVTGELSGTWGDTVNNSITSLVDTAVAGTTNVSADSNVTLTTTTGASNQARQAILLFSGARTAIRTVTAPAQSKIYTVINATTGGFAVQLVGAGPTTGVTIPNGGRTTVAWNGSDFVEVSSPSSIILPGGTANGVLYLNGSKVVTSGSALTYDGTSLGISYTANARGGINLTTTNNSGTSEQGGFTATNGNATGLFAGVNGAAYTTGGIGNANQAVIYSIGNASLVLGTNTTEAARFDTAGNFGLGVSPAAWASLVKAIQIGSLISIAQNDAGSGYFGRNQYNSSTGYRYLTTETAQLFGPQSNGAFAWYNAPSGTAGNAITWTQAMTLDASGNLALGKTSTSYRLGMQVASSGTNVSALEITNATNASFEVFIKTDTTTVNAGGAGNLVFATGGSVTERARITSDGNLLIGTTTHNEGGIVVYRGGSLASAIVFYNQSTGTGANDGLYVGLGGAGATDAYVYNREAGNLIFGTSNTERARIASAGGLSIAGGLAVGTLTSYPSNFFLASAVLSAGAGTYPLKWNSSTGIVTYDTSSRLVKENIEDSPYGLDEVLQLKPRKYYRTDDQRNEIGLVADEVQAVMPEFVPLVEKSIFTKDEADTELIAGGVNYDKLTSVLIKAIQEQQAIIESLKARLDAANL